MVSDTTEKAKKQTVRTLATELNISHDSLIEFLQSKGFSGIKSIMSKIDDDALEATMKQFGKEKDVAEKRQKKVAAFKEKRAKTKGEDIAAKAAAEHPPEKEVVHEPEPPVIEVETPEIIEVPEIVVEHQPVEETPVVTTEEPAPETVVVTGEPQITSEHATDEEGEHGDDEHKRKRRKKKTTTVLITSSSTPGELPPPMPGLKIKGKIDLEALKPKKKEASKPLQIRKVGDKLADKKTLDSYFDFYQKHY